MKVKTTLGRFVAVSVAVALAHATAPIVQAAPHLVDPSQMTARLVEQAQSRQQKIELFQTALSAPEVKQQAKALGLDAEKLSQRISQLSDKELADLSARALKVKDVAAGHRHHHGSDEALIILGVALLLAAVLILAVANSDDDYCGDCW